MHRLALPIVMVCATGLLLSMADVVFADMRLLDSDEWRGEHSNVHVSLGRQETYSRFCELTVEIHRFLENYAFSGPMLISVYVYLPMYAEGIHFSDASTKWIGLSPTGYDTIPDVTSTGSFCVAHWDKANTPPNVGRNWLFAFHDRSSIIFEIPEDKPAWAFVYVETAFYSFDVLFFRKVADDRAYWLHVESTTSDSSEPDAIPQAEGQTILLAGLGLDLICGGLIAAVVASYLLLKKRAMKQQLSLQPSSTAMPSLETRQGAYIAPLDLMLFLLFYFLAGFITAVNGWSILEWQLPLGMAHMTSGVFIIIISAALWKLKAWAWYATMAFNIVGFIDMLLFPSITPYVALQPLVLLYLAWRHPLFKAHSQLRP